MNRLVPWCNHLRKQHGATHILQTTMSEVSFLIQLSVVIVMVGSLKSHLFLERMQLRRDQNEACKLRSEFIR